jgi:hypothetical protein
LLLSLAYVLSGREGTGAQASFSLLIGTALGIIFERARFCFFCIFRDAIEDRNTTPILSVLSAIAVGSVVALLAFLFRNWWLPASVDIHPIEEGKKKIKKPRIFLILGILGFCGQVGEGAAGDWGGILAREEFGASPFLSSMPYVVFSATMVIGRLFGDQITAKYPAGKVLSAGGLISGGGLIVGLLIGGIYGQIFGWLTLGAGLSILVPILFSESGRIAKEDYPGELAPSEGVAMVSGVAYFGFMAGPPIIGFLSGFMDLRWAMLFPGVLALILGFSAKRVISK